MSIEAIKEALEAVQPCGQWHRSRAAIDVDESEEWAHARIEVRANKLINRKLAAFIAACNPVAIRSLIERMEAAELKVKELRGDHVPTPDDISAQDWSGMDGAIAYHLIDRHGENWSHIGRLMHAWRDAAIDSAMAGGLAEGVSDVR